VTLMDTAEENAESDADLLDDLAAFLMQRAYEPGVTDVDRLQTFALVNAYQEGDEPRAVESAMRLVAVQFTDHPAYRDSWRPRSEL
jgi:hypothetical protein